jgi:hypothetical protein
MDESSSDGGGGVSAGAAALRAELLEAAAALSDRGLRQSARWALEMHGGVADDAPALPCALGARARAAAAAGRGAPRDEAAFQLARLYLDGREFARAAGVLDARHAPRGAGAPAPQTYPPRHFFLRSYALYLVRAAAARRVVPGGARPAVCPIQRARARALARVRALARARSHSRTRSPPRTAFSLPSPPARSGGTAAARN